MVEEVVANPGLMPPSYCVINGQPAYIPLFNGLLEQQIFGVPIYIGIIMILVLAFIGLAVYFFLHWWYMGPVWKYYDAVKNKIDLGIYIGKQGRVTLEPVEYIGAAFKSIGLSTYWVQLAASGLRWGGTNTVILTDTVGIVKDPKMQVAIKTAITQWNMGEKAEDELIRNAAIQAKAQGKYQPITDYETLYKVAIGSKLLPDIIRIPAVAEVPIHELDRYLQDVDLGKLTLAVNKATAELTKANDPMEKYKAILYLFVVLAVIIVGAAIAGYVITMWK